MTRPTTREIADVLNVLIESDAEMAAVINALLGCSDDDRLTDRQAEIGEALFNTLVCLRPEAVNIATGMTP